ncbi:MAG TPA: glycoside hydrolase family 76 protein [Kofleriaceae bacterium]|nr:glycoside hydrolase family 76 protein [Kofleriaceae bacterium]
MKTWCILLAACAHPGGGTGSVDSPGGAAVVDGAVSPDAAGVDAAPWHAHADDATASLLLHFWSPSYLNDASPSTGVATGYWTFAQAWDAVLDGAERTGGAKFAGWIEGLYLAQNARGWSSNFYDDENWMTLALVRAYDLAGDAKYLAEAKALYADIEAAWDTTCCGATPGGIWWDRAHTQKATASNAGPVIAGVRLAARTGDASYLAFAKQVYAYWRAHMVDPTTYAVSDHEKPDGTVVTYRFTYNEGLVIGAAVALYGATGTAQYLADARGVAGYMLSAETRDGILFDGDNTHCTGDCAQFKGIGYRYLSELQAIDPSPDLAAVLAASGQAVWTDARGSGNLFATDWAGPPATPTSIDADSSAAMTLNLYAEALGAAPPPTDTRYQAEDGVVHAIGLEASHAGFAGWGYLAGWNGDGQWVDFHVHVAAAGTYTLTLGYAAGAGNASRLVYANGANAVPNLALPSTGSWDAWATQTARVALPAGTSTISIIFNSSLGSSSYVNLDWITVAP